MLVNVDYGAYTSVYAALEFLWSISEHLKDKFLAQIHECPSFSLMIDESTDRTLEQHLIIIVCYITGNGSGVPGLLNLWSYRQLPLVLVNQYMQRLMRF